MPKYKIMIAEDEKIVAADIQMNLEKMGYSVCAMASSGIEAIKKAESTRPDLILMDIVLKGSMDGIEAATQIKELYEIPVVYLTAFGDDSILQKAKVAEPYGYITKPFRYRELQIAIEISIYKKQAEARIQKMERWLATVLRSIGDAVIASDNEHRITFLNAVAERLTGWNQEDALGRKITEVLNIKDQDLSDLEKHLVEKVIMDGLIINLIEDRLLIAKDGTEASISDSVAPIKEENGETQGTVLVFRDITEQKVMEENLRTHQVELEAQNEALRRTQAELEASRARYFDLYDQAPVGYVTLSEHGLIMEANLTAATLLGLTRSALIKQHLTSFILPEDRDINYLHRKLLFKTEKPQAYEVRMIKSDGAPFWVRLEATAAKDTDGSLICRTVMSDVTERKQAEEELNESKALVEAVVENVPLMVFLKEATDLRFVIFNRAGEELLGYDRRDLIGKNNLDLFPPEQAAHFMAKDRSVLDGDMGILDIPEEHITTANKGQRILHTRKVCIRGGDGVTKYLLGISEDITERKQAEEEKKRLQERLQRSEKMESLGTLAGGVAHDLNNVLGIVVGYAEMLLDDVDEKSPLRAGLLNIMDGGQRAAAIVQDLLTLARRGVSGRQVLNLNKIIIDCSQFPEFENLSAYHSEVKIETDLEPDLLNISGSSVHLGKTLFNLISNAGEAMTRGGILTIKTANQYIDKPIHGYDQIREGDYVVLTVSDTGEGIPEADLKRIFEPFYTRKILGRSGTGLGLAVVWGTVKDHNGYIDVESEEGKGSTFALYFPVTREDITAEAAAISISEYMGKGETILVVDDVKGQRDLATGMLRKLNYNVTSVSSGEEAVTYLKEHDVDLMVLDMIMNPGIDGLDTYKNVLDIHPKQKAIIVSGFSESDRVYAAQALGAGTYVKKPYVIEKLGLAVKNELDRAA